MATNKIPTLVIGIGGVGCRIARDINKRLNDEDKKCIGIVGIDTNISDLNLMKKEKLKTIQISDERRVGEFLIEKPEYQEWFPVMKSLTDLGMSNGAGQIRAISRLAAVAAEAQGVFSPIEKEINRIRDKKNGGHSGTVAVVITGSITGGTGAGMFLQLPFYIRKILKNAAGLEHIIIRGVFIGSDITRSVQPGEDNRRAVSVNAYTCIKELNAFYLTQEDSELAKKLKIDFYEPESGADIDHLLTGDTGDAITLDAVADHKALFGPKTSIPYNYLYLIESCNGQGGLGSVVLGNVENMVARMIYYLMFTPITGDAMSVEDNFRMKQISHNGMNRYGSMGCCRLVYPEDAALSYVTQCQARDIVQGEWTLLDRKFEVDKAAAEAQKRIDGRVKIPDIADAYCTYFEQEVKNVGGSLGNLYNEAYREGNGNIVTSLAESYLNTVSTAIESSLRSADIEKEKGKCTIKPEDFSTYDQAFQSVMRIEKDLKSYQKLAELYVESKYISFVGEYFPADWDTLQQNKDRQTCVYKWLASVHPVTARFFCYSLMRELQKRIEDNKTLFEAKYNKLFDYWSFDFDGKPDNGVQSAGAAVVNQQNRQNWLVMQFAQGISIKKLKSRITGQYTQAVSTIGAYLRHGFTLHVCEEMLKRVTMLVANYETFFKSVNKMVLSNNDNISRLENLILDIDTVGIYCSKEAFRYMAQNYTMHELPDATKAAIFEQVYKEVTTEIEDAGKEATETQKQKRNKAKQDRLGKLFNTAIINTIYTELVNNSDGVIRMNARQALIREFELTTGKTEHNCDDYNNELMKYLQKRVGDAMQQAEPLISVKDSAKAGLTEMAFFALHPDCAEQKDEKPDKDATLQYYLPGLDDVTEGKASVLMDEQFDNRELVCMRASYLYEIEALNQYSVDSVNAKEYRNRIAHMGGISQADMLAENKVLKIVNPHLHRFWHEEGILPALTEPEREQYRKDTLKAFVYIIGLDLVRIKVDNGNYSGVAGLKVWADTLSGNPLYYKGSYVPGSFNSLFEALECNRKLRIYALDSARTYCRQAKGFLPAEELARTILDQDFIADLIHFSDGTPENESLREANLFDIFYEMHGGMKPERWEALFDGLMWALWDVCSNLFGGDRSLVNNSVELILHKMYENCGTYKREQNGEQLTYVDDALKTQLAKLYDMKFFAKE